MKTSRIAIFHAKDLPFTYETVAVPALRPGELLVRNEYTTLCRSDLNTYAGKRIEKTPTILGHEIVGTIEELGPDAPAVDSRGAPLRVGDRVTWAIYASDPCSCLARRGIPQKGEDLFKYGHERITPESNLHGGLSEYCVLRKHTPVIRIDAAIPLPVSALINCSVATVAGALRLAGDVRDRARADRRRRHVGHHRMRHGPQRGCEMGDGRGHRRCASRDGPGVWRRSHGEFRDGRKIPERIRR
jgi:D-arabinose 1-dehydrogenase-like Zn-dependent alcohol dehydrogenase